MVYERPYFSNEIYRTLNYNFYYFYMCKDLEILYISLFEYKGEFSCSTCLSFENKIENYFNRGFNLFIETKVPVVFRKSDFVFL